MDLHNQNDDEVAAAPGELLEDCWFFGNLLQTKSKSNSSRLMLRSLSDPCSSSTFPGKSYEETYDSITKREGERSKSNRKIDQSLVRAPSLPTSFQTSDDFHDDEEMEFSMGKLIRQASLNHSDTRPPRTTRRISTAKSLTKQKSRLKAPEMESVDDHKSLKDLEIEGFKDFDDKEFVQDKKRVEGGARAAPPVPRWGGKRSTEDMKAQIKFWARAVASNVRQEC